MKKRTSLSLIISGLLLMLSGTTSAQEILTLEKALEIAYRQSPSLIQSKMSLEQSELSLLQQKASLKSLFRFDLTPFNYSRRSNFEDISSTWNTYRTMSAGGNFSITQPLKWTDGKLTLSNNFRWQDAQNQSSNLKNTSFSNDLTLQLDQPIFTHNQTKIDLKQLEFNLENAKINYAMKQLDIEKTVTSAFYNVYQSFKSLVDAREAYESAKQNNDITKDKVEQGLLAKEELFQSEVTLANTEMSLYDAETNYASTRDQFKLTLGIPLDMDISVLPNTDVTPVEVDPNLAIKYALDQRMEIRQKQISIEQGLFDLITAKATNEFKGNISAQVGLFGNGDKVKGAFTKPEDNESVGVTLTIPIWDWGTRKAAIRKAQIANENNEIDLDEFKKSVALDIRQICRELPKLSKQIEIARKNVTNAERTYDISVEKYRSGTLSGIELKTQQEQLTKAKNEYTNTLITYKLKLLDLKIQTLWDFQTNNSYLPVDLLK